MIRAANITKTYNVDEVEVPVLRGVSLSVAEGEFVAIMGRSGAGKSTLLYQLSALERPTTGTVELAGQSVAKLGAAKLSDFRLRTLGYVFQDYALVPDLTAVENVLVPLLMRGIDWPKGYAQAVAAIERVGLADKVEQLPSKLSGGEQQRISIARAIAGNPKILFADEPTANLDSVSGQAVLELFYELHQSGQTIVMVTHEAEYTAHCDRVITLHDGLIVTDQRLRPDEVV